MAETCNICNLVHAAPEFPEGANAHARDALTAMACIDAQKTAMRYLLQKAGRKTTCDGCGKTIYFVHHTNGSNTPYTEAGLVHFIDCPERDRFRRPKP